MAMMMRGTVVTPLPVDYSGGRGHYRTIVPLGWSIVEYIANTDEWRIAPKWYAPPARVLVYGWYLWWWSLSIRRHLRDWWMNRPRYVRYGR